MHASQLNSNRQSASDPPRVDANPGVPHPTGGFPTRWLVLTLIALVAIVFGQTWSFPPFAIDDADYVFDNPYVLAGLTGKSITWAFTTTDSASFGMPLLWLSLMLDREIWGAYAGGFHLTNVLLHTCNALLLYRLMWQFGSGAGRGFVVSAVFALHPLHVESVAWIAERKDVLSTLFGLLSILGYVRFVRLRSTKAYLLSLVLFLASLLSKHMLVTLPFVFLVIDYWPLRRGTESYRRLIAEKLPFVAFTALFCSIALFAQSAEGTKSPLGEISLAARCANAINAVAFYLAKTFWPTRLAAFYPHPGNTIAPAPLLVSAGTILTVTALALRQMRHRPYLLAGWLWFIGTLVPVLGFVQIGAQAMADRYTYFPMIGLIFAAAWLTANVVQSQTVLRGASVAALLALSVLSFQQVGYWRDSVVLLERTLTVTRRNWFAHATLGIELMKRADRANESEWHLRESIRLFPAFAFPHFGLGMLLSQRRELHDANVEFKRALAIEPNYINGHLYLLINMARLGHKQEFRQHYTKLPPEVRVKIDEFLAAGGDSVESLLKKSAPGEKPKAGSNDVTAGPN